jgi:hypothetical protein
MFVFITPGSFQLREQPALNFADSLLQHSKIYLYKSA